MAPRPSHQPHHHARLTALLCLLAAWSAATQAVTTNAVTVDSRGVVRFGPQVIYGRAGEPIQDTWELVGDTPQAALDYLRERCHASRAALARAEKLIRAQLAEPSIAVEPTPVEAPLDELIEVPVTGKALAKGFRIADVAAPIIDAAPSDDGHALRITGRLPGSTSVTLTRDGLKLTVPVEVKARAARPLTEVMLEVSGQPTPDQLAQAALAAAEPLLARPLGTRLTVTSPDDTTLRLRAAGDGLLPSDSTVAIACERVPFEPTSASRVLPSHTAAPPSMPGLIARWALTDQATCRAVGWQVNGGSTRLAIGARLANGGDQPARVWLNLSATGPTDNALWAGHKAAREYLRSHLADGGLFLTVPPRSAWVVCCREARPGHGVGWLGDVRLLSGADVEWQVLALDPDAARLGPQTLGVDPKLLGPAPEPTGPLPERLTEVITADDATRVVEATCGSAAPDCRGVRYRYTMLLTNPSGAPMPWAVAIAPVEGQAQVTLEVDGKLIETPVITSDSPFVWVQPLEPGEQRAVHLSLVVPTGGSLPLRLRVGPFALVAAP